MQDKLSAIIVYKNALKSVSIHKETYAFLSVFFFLGYLLPAVLGTTLFKLILIPYYYLLIYFAAGLYYKRSILWDKSIFYAAGIRFFMVVVLFIASYQVSTSVINFILNTVGQTFVGGRIVVTWITYHKTWEYLFLLVLFVAFFIIPSFAFVSEITGKSRSILATYAKTKGNFLMISTVALLAYLLLIALMVLLFFIRNVNVYAAAVPYSMFLAFLSIVYFNLYDFFYYSPALNKTMKIDTNTHKEDPDDKVVIEVAENKSKGGKHAHQG